MKLSEAEAELFFDTMWPLQFYANKRLRIISNIDSLEEYIQKSYEEKYLVRQAMYNNPKVIDAFIEDNPNDFGAEQLSIVKMWRRFIKGNFYIERYLKKHAIFIGNDHVYVVLSLNDTFDEVLPKATLPIYIETVLLPFQGKIVYDGLMSRFNVEIGNDIRRELREIYLQAKENDEIIFSLEADHEEPEREPEASQPIDWSEGFRELTAISERLKGEPGQPAIHGMAFELVRSSVAFASKATSQSREAVPLQEQLTKVQEAVQQLEDTLHDME